MVMGALLACEEHLHITVGFSLKTDSELGLLCRFEEPTVVEAITADFKTKTDSEVPYRHLLVKKYKKTLSVWSLPSQPFYKKYKKKIPEPRIQTQVSGFLVWSLNHYARIGIMLELVVLFLLSYRNPLLNNKCKIKKV